MSEKSHLHPSVHKPDYVPVGQDSDPGPLPERTPDRSAVGAPVIDDPLHKALERVKQNVRYIGPKPTE